MTRVQKYYVYLFCSLIGTFLSERALYGEAVPVGDYGSILQETPYYFTNAFLETVVIYAREDASSVKTIPRKGILLRNKKAKATIIICHGFMCEKEDVAFLRHLFPKSQYNILVFDFRAHGEHREQQFCTFGRDEAYDVIAAAHFVRNHPQLKGKPVFIYGFSMGAVAAIEAQAKDTRVADAMILDCPFDSSENVIKKGLERLKVSIFGYEFEIPGKRWLERYAFHPYVQAMVKVVLKTVAHLDTQNIQTNICPLYPSESIKKVTVPCFFIHCKNDEKVPLGSVKTIYQGATGYKRLWITKGRRHYDSFFSNPEKYKIEIREFLEKVQDGSIVKEEQEKVIEDVDDKTL